MVEMQPGIAKFTFAAGAHGLVWRPGTTEIERVSCQARLLGVKPLWSINMIKQPPSPADGYSVQILDGCQAWTELLKCKMSGKPYEVWFCKDRKSIEEDQKKADEEKRRKEAEKKEKEALAAREKQIKEDAEKKRADAQAKKKEEELLAAEAEAAAASNATASAAPAEPAPAEDAGNEPGRDEAAEEGGEAPPAEEEN